MSDDEVLAATDNGRFGPGIIGRELHDRAQRILKDTGGGLFGPAITDPNYAKKQAAKRAASMDTDEGDDIDETSDDLEDDERRVPDSEFTGDVDPMNLDDPRNPWSYVTLSGAKMLAQQKQVSYAPRIKRKDLIAALQAAGVTPPPVPENPNAGDED